MYEIIDLLWYPLRQIKMLLAGLLIAYRDCLELNEKARLHTTGATNRGNILGPFNFVPEDPWSHTKAVKKEIFGKSGIILVGGAGPADLASPPNKKGKDEAEPVFHATPGIVAQDAGEQKYLFRIAMPLTKVNIAHTHHPINPNALVCHIATLPSGVDPWLRFWGSGCFDGRRRCHHLRVSASPQTGFRPLLDREAYDSIAKSA